MSFENIGIGGVLSFDSKGAVSNMGIAQRAFASLSQAAAKVQMNVAKVGQGMSGLFGGLSMVGAGAIAGVGYGIQKWVRSGIDFNKEMEGSTLAIATILSTVKKTPLDTEMVNAKQAMMDLNKVAAEAPGELTDIVGIFQQMAGPMTVGGAKMEDMYKATKGTAIFAGLLKRSFNDTGAAMSKLTAGQVEMGNDIHMMLKSMGLLTETTQEWKALLPEQRVKRVMEMLKTFEGSGERVGKTWEATSSTTTSLIKMMAGSFTSKMFSNMTGGLTSFNDKFFAHQKEWMAKAEEFGARFGQAIQFVIGTVKDLGTQMLSTIQKVRSKFDHLSMSVDTGLLKHIATIAIKVSALAVAFSPVITIVGFLAGKLGAIVTIAQGLVGIVSAIGLPLLPFIAAAGALFLLFRKDGETIGETLKRGFEYIKAIGQQIYTAVQPGIHMLQLAFAIMRDSLASMWAHVQPGLAQLRQALSGVVQFAVQVGTTLFNIFSKIVAVAAAIWRQIEPGLSAVFNAVMRLVNAVVGAVNYMWPKLMAVISPIIDVLLQVGLAIGKVIGKALQLLAPMIDAFTWLFKKVLVPLAGFVLDTFGPVVVNSFKMIGAAVEFLLGVLGKVIDGMKWLADKAASIYGGVADAIGAVFEGTDVMGLMLEKAQGKMYDTNQVVDQFVRNIQLQMAMAKLAAMGAQEVVMLVAKSLQSLYNDTLKPIVDQGVQIINMFKGDAEIKAKQPDVTVNVDVNNKSTMCVNGRNLAVAQGQYETEVAERSGFNRTPWQTQRVQISGVKP